MIKILAFRFGQWHEMARTKLIPVAHIIKSALVQSGYTHVKLEVE